MTSDPASLQNLHDIVVPPPVPWWPPAPGWYLVMAIALGLAVVVAARAVIRYRRNAYRRAALAELQVLALDGDALPRIAALLKRTALAAYPREHVASLAGQPWLTWLGDTSGLTVPPAVGAALTHGVYAGTSPTKAEALIEFAARWIRRHKDAGPC